ASGHRDVDPEARLADALGPAAEGGIPGGALRHRLERRSGRDRLWDAAFFAGQGGAELRRPERPADGRMARGGTAPGRPRAARGDLSKDRAAAGRAAALHLPVLPAHPGRDGPATGRGQSRTARTDRDLPRRLPPARHGTRRPVIPFLARRILSVLPTLFGVTAVAFGILNLLPSDPSQVWSAGSAPTAEAVAHLRSVLGADQGPAARYVSWALGLFRGDLGHSLRDGRP